MPGRITVRLIALSLVLLALPGCESLDRAFGVDEPPAPPPAQADAPGTPEAPPLTEKGEQVLQGAKAIPDLESDDVLGIAATAFPQYAPWLALFGVGYKTWREWEKRKKAEAVNVNLVQSFEPLVRKFPPEDKQLLKDIQTPDTKAAVKKAKAAVK